MLLGLLKIVERALDYLILMRQFKFKKLQPDVYAQIGETISSKRLSADEIECYLEGNDAKYFNKTSAK
jgi:hypothetical protein